MEGKLKIERYATVDNGKVLLDFDFLHEGREYPVFALGQNGNLRSSEDLVYYLSVYHRALTRERVRELLGQLNPKDFCEDLELYIGYGEFRGFKLPISKKCVREFTKKIMDWIQDKFSKVYEENEKNDIRDWLKIKRYLVDQNKWEEV